MISPLPVKIIAKKLLTHQLSYLCPMRAVTPIGETRLPSPGRTLLLLPRSYGLIRRSQQALLYFGFSSLEESLQVVIPSLLPAGPSRRYLRESFLGCLIPYPGGPTACTYLFLPLCHRPYPTTAMGRLPASDPLETTSCGAGISGRQIFLYVQASKFALPPRSSLPLRTLPQGSRGFYVRAERASLPPHAPDMLTVRVQATDGTRTFTSLDSRPCRPLPAVSSFVPV
jgi:hypothetical protein